MNDQTRRAALRATAKIALSLTVVGCTTSVLDDSNSAEAPAEEAPTIVVATPNDDAPADEPPRVIPRAPERNDIVEPLACGAPEPGDEVVIDDEQLGCCLDMLEPLVVSTSGNTWEQWQQEAADPAVYGCCMVAIAHVDADWSKSETVGSDAMMSCCGLGIIGWACTPWGPPMPPMFDARLAAAFDRMELV